MSTRIAEAYVQIKPTTKGIKNELTSQLSGDVSSAGDSAGQSFGSAMVSKLKGIVAAAGIGTIVKQALDAGGAVQQSFGGLDTLYGEASEAAKKYAREAAAAGISMNDYAEQAVSFGAGLKQAFGGDTQKAVEAANTAIMDMADNAAKMGTPLENIQNAYQGFAKQNYTMLDNLKLGYGGTKQEMERLLADAEKLSGVKYDMENLGDVYSAIHVIQEDLKLTGVAADEAKTTFTGSLGAMKAALTNFLADLTTGGDIQSSLSVLIQSAMTFLQGNLLPMVGSLVQAIPGVLAQIGSSIIQELNNLKNNIDFSSMIDKGGEFVSNLLTGIVTDIPYIIESALGLAAKFGETLINYDWWGTASNILSEFSNSISLAAGEIFGEDNFLEGLLNTISEQLPLFLEKGKEIITGIITGISEKLPEVLSKIGEFIPMVVSFISTNLPVIFSTIGELIRVAISNLPAILSAAWDLIKTLLSNLPQIIGSILSSLFAFIDGLTGGFFSKAIAAVQEFLDKPLYYIGLAIGTIIRKIGEFFVELYNKAIEFFTVTIPNAWNDFKTWLSELPEKVKEVWNSLPDMLKTAGSDAIAGMWEGVKERFNRLVEDAKELARGLVDGIKGTLDIGSPSKVFAKEVGHWIPAGIAVGIEGNTSAVTDAMNELSSATIDTTAGVDLGMSYSNNVNTNTSTDISPVVALLAEYLPGLANQQIILDGTTLVGATASKMDMALGQISDKNMRGVVIA